MCSSSSADADADIPASATSPVRITDTDLPPARSEHAFALHRAACEWRLDRPILIRDENDILSRDQIDVTPYAHQIKNLITFCRRAPVALLADDVGLGKTISAGLILAELVQRGKVRKALVVCPGILVAQWERELTDKFRLPVATAFGKQIREAMTIEAGVIVTTYETAREHMDALADASIQMLILDEAHRLRRLHGSDHPPRVATRVRDAIEQRWFKFVLLLTATPIQNRVWDLYSLIDVLSVARGHRHPLGTPDDFAERYIAGNRQKALEIHPERLAEFREHVREYVVRTRRSESGLLFPRRDVVLHRVEASAAERRLGRLLGLDLGKLPVLAQISLAQALMSSPEALVAQLENMVRKAPSLEGCLHAARAFVEEGQASAKMLGLQLIVHELRQTRADDEFRLVVFTGRKETQNVIGAFLAEQGISCGFVRGGCAPENREAIERFVASPPEAHVLVSTDAGAEGVNLQAANVIVNFDLPWNPMVMEQRIGRVQRLGSKYATVSIINLVVADSVEERIVARLAEKLLLIGEAVGEIDAILESSRVGANAKGEEVGESFENAIRKLVVESLQGKDTSEAVRLEVESIDEARHIFEANRAVMETQLGDLGDLHTSGPAAPDLPAREPAMSLEAFVVGALEEDGATIAATHAGHIEGFAANGLEFRAFVGLERDGRTDRHVIAYVPGEAAFDALARRWSEEHAALVHDRRGASDEVLRAIAERWCATIPGAALHDWRRIDSRTVFQGAVDCIARADVAHDTYATVVSVVARPEGHDEIPSDPLDDVLCAEAVRAGTLFEGDAIERAVVEDPGIREFCRFYGERGTEELARVDDDDSDAEARARELFAPTIHARVAGAQGTRYDVVRVALSVELDGDAQYDAEIEIVPLTLQVTYAPELGTCAQSGRNVPAAWLDRCCESSKLALPHSMLRSDLSGRLALPELVERCSVTGKQLLRSEMERSAVSGIVADRDALAVSAISGKRALRSEIVRCDFTGVDALPDEVVESRVSGRTLRRDQQVVSAISGTAGHLSELVTCELSGSYMLPEEVGRSDFSGLLVRRDWLRTTDSEPRRTGTFLEISRCAQTGRWLSRDEIETSSVSRKLVDKSLLVASDASGALALPEEMVLCEISGQRLLPAESASCVVSGRRARRDLMIKSKASGCSLFPGTEVRSELSGSPMAPSEAFRCPWLGLRLLPQEAGTCAITGLRVAGAALNAAGELADLRRVLDRAENGESATDVVEWARGSGMPVLRDVIAAAAIEAPRGPLRAVALVAKVAGVFWWVVGLVVEAASPNGELTLRGDGCAVGYRLLGRWHRTQASIAPVP